MKSEDEDKNSTDGIRTRPKTPRQRPPLPRMMPHSEPEKTRPKNTCNDESKEDDTSSESDELDNVPTSKSKNSSRQVSKGDTQISKPIRRKPTTSPPNNQKSTISQPLPQIIPSRKKNANESQTAHYSKISNKPCSLDHVDSKQSANIIWSIIKCSPIIIICIIGYLYSPMWNNELSANPNTVNVEESTFKNIMRDFEANINNINYNFKNQHSKFWNEIYAGIVNIKLHPKKRSIIFLFSNDEDPMSCLADMIGNASKSVLNTDILHLSSSDLGNDFGSVIDKFKEQIKQKRVVIVDNLLDIDVEALRAFHNLCDSENPLVRQTIYILTMIANGYKNGEKPIDFVTKQLERKLKGKIQPDKLQPLITRITDGAIYPVQPEPDFTSCPLRY